jgi:hypothetical protein
MYSFNKIHSLQRTRREAAKKINVEQSGFFSVISTAPFSNLLHEYQLLMMQGMEVIIPKIFGTSGKVYRQRIETYDHTYKNTILLQTRILIQITIRKE